MRKAESRVVQFLEPPSPTNFPRNIKKPLETGFYRPNLNILTQNDSKYQSIALNDIEDWILNLKISDLLSQEDQTLNVDFLYELMQKYSSKAASHYSGDPFLISRSIIASLNILRFIDEILCKTVPLIKDHRIKIPLKFISEHLLVKNKSELDFLADLLMYFEERQEKAKFPWILKEKLSEDNFSVRFYDQDPEMKNLRKKIEEWNEDLKEKKKNL